MWTIQPGMGMCTSPAPTKSPEESPSDLTLKVNNVSLKAVHPIK
jgi:hypothetical protein